MATRKKTSTAPAVAQESTALEIPAELEHLNIDPTFLALSDAELATAAFNAETNIADVKAEVEAVLAQQRSHLNSAKAILTYRLLKDNATSIMHPTLDVELTQKTERQRGEAQILALKKEFPDADWSAAVVTKEIPAHTETKIDLRGVDKLIKKFGDSPLGAALKNATGRVFVGPPVLTIALRPDAIKNVTRND